MGQRPATWTTFAQRRSGKAWPRLTGLIMANKNPNTSGLNRGGNEGNKFGAGEPSGTIKGNLKQILETHGVKKLESIVSGEEPGVTPGESLKGVEICAKYVLTEPNVIIPELFLKAVARTAIKYLDPEQMEAFTGDLMIEIREVI